MPVRRSRRSRELPAREHAKTRCYYGETLPNPKLTVFPIAEVAKIGREFGIPLIMDNTACPVLCRPIEHGAAITMHSTTKYIGGHGTSIGGIIVDGGNFDWEKHADRFPMLNTPDPSYHGAVWTQAVKPLGPIAYIIKARVTLLRDIGAAASPFNCFLHIQGLESVVVRMRQHCANATAVADWLKKHPKVTKVIFPGLMSGEMKRRADTYLKGGYGGLVGFELKGGRDAGRKFIDALKMFYHVVNIGDARSLAIHPATTTHSQLTPEELLKTGVTDAYVRLSVGTMVNRPFPYSFRTGLPLLAKIYGLLFKAASEALITIAADRKHLGAGRTWSRKRRINSAVSMRRSRRIERQGPTSASAGQSTGKPAQKMARWNASFEVEQVKQLPLIARLRVDPLALDQLLHPTIDPRAPQGDRHRPAGIARRAILSGPDFQGLVRLFPT